MEFVTQFLSSLKDTLGKINIPSLLTAAVLSFVVTFLYDRFVVRSKERKNEEERKLKMHFEQDLVKEATTITTLCNSVTQRFGAIVSAENFQPALFPQPSDVFAAHFPLETAELAKNAKQIGIHNTTYDALVSRIKRHLEARGFSVGPDTPTKFSPFIYDGVFRLLFHYWDDLHCGRTTPRPDFEKVDPIPEKGSNDLFASGWASEPVAYAEAEVDKNGCRQLLYEVSQDMSYQREAFSVIESADSLTNQVKSFATQLDSRISDVRNYWPGTVSCKFKIKKEKCTKCKEIFG